jgi:hypothetical protein
MIVFTINLVSFSHLSSFLFEKHAAASAHLPVLLIGVHIFAAFMLLAVAAVSHDQTVFGFLSDYNAAGIILWIVTFLSPHGAMFAGLLYATSATSVEASLLQYPTSAETCIVMACESVIFFMIVLSIDGSNLLGTRSRANNALNASGKTTVIGAIDQTSIQAERARVEDYVRSIAGIPKKKMFSLTSPAKPYLSAQEVESNRQTLSEYFPTMSPAPSTPGGGSTFEFEAGSPRLSRKSVMSTLNTSTDAVSICVNKLMLQFPNKKRHLESVGANIRGQITGVEDVSFAVNRGEIFGLVMYITPFNL